MDTIKVKQGLSTITAHFDSNILNDSLHIGTTVQLPNFLYLKGSFTLQAELSRTEPDWTEPSE